MSRILLDLRCSLPLHRALGACAAPSTHRRRRWQARRRPSPRHCHRRVRAESGDCRLSQLQDQRRLRGQGCRQLLRRDAGLRQQGQPDRPGRGAGAMPGQGHDGHVRLPARSPPASATTASAWRRPSTGRPSRSDPCPLEKVQLMLYAQVHLTLPAWVHESVDAGGGLRQRCRQGGAGDRTVAHQYRSRHRRAIRRGGIRSRRPHHLDRRQPRAAAEHARWPMPRTWPTCWPSSACRPRASTSASAAP